jgi:hypothetical protein
MVKFGALAGACQKITLKQYFVDFYLGFTAFGAPLDVFCLWY